jgi:plasmid stabilization system protein ParE
MARVRQLLAVDSDIENALRRTRRKFGVHKYNDYAALIEEALEALGADPKAGRARPDIDPEAWILPIGKPGRRARHVLMYRIVDPDLTITGTEPKSRARTASLTAMVPDYCGSPGGAVHSVQEAPG